MDIVNQNKFKNILLVFLIVVNLLTVSIIWMQTANRNEQSPKEQNNRPSESVDLMKKTLDLDEGQTAQLEKIRTFQLDLLKKYNDKLDEVKKQLADELFKDKPDTALANTKVKEIGELQAKVESIRFKHFNELLSICTPKQKEKMKPVIMEVFSKKPPKNLQEDKKPPKEQRDMTKEKENNIKESELTGKRDEKSAPPSQDEKLAKYSQRLNLSAEQQQKVKAIFQISKQRGEQLRKKANPAPNKIEIEKEKNRKEEDNSIMKILNEEQKTEFSKMISKRNK